MYSADYPLQLLARFPPQMVSLLATTYGRACGHEASLAMGASFRRLSKWVARCRALCPELGSMLMKGGHERALRALIKAASAENAPAAGTAAFSAQTIVEFCADFKFHHRSYLSDFFEQQVRPGRCGRLRECWIDCLCCSADLLEPRDGGEAPGGFEVTPGEGGGRFGGVKELRDRG